MIKTVNQYPISDVFSNQNNAVYRIPKYQREYTWGIKDWDALFDDVIDNEADLEDVLEEFNDMTGICPVIYTVYTEEYDRRYADLESYAYDYYVDNWSDEQHYLIVYAIPEDQAERAGRHDLGEIPAEP